MVLAELLPPQPVRATVLTARAKMRARLALRNLELRRLERRRENTSSAPARDAGRGRCSQGEPGRLGVWAEAVRTPGRAALAVVQAVELV